MIEGIDLDTNRKNTVDNMAAVFKNMEACKPLVSREAYPAMVALFNGFSHSIDQRDAMAETISHLIGVVSMAGWGDDVACWSAKFVCQFYMLGKLPPEVKIDLERAHVLAHTFVYRICRPMLNELNGVRTSPLFQEARKITINEVVRITNAFVDDDRLSGMRIRDRIAELVDQYLSE